MRSENASAENLGWFCEAVAFWEGGNAAWGVWDSEGGRK